MALQEKSQNLGTLPFTVKKLSQTEGRGWGAQQGGWATTPQYLEG